ncbi:MAG: type III secretion system inner membrane ring subunit SctD [Deltaproteobacteria bacterium]|jgi:type III secretion protein D|nr:type III secretion system inner membrane ring subunit SctD [Deltaproteobacteria bacterium]
MSREILLGIFTGIHAGAEILLREGEHSLGTDEDNDIILSDSTLAPKHCLLILAAQGDLLLRPLEGELSSGNAEFSLPPSTTMLAGKVCLAWTPKGTKWGPMRMPSLLTAAEPPGTAGGQVAAPQTAAPQADAHHANANQVGGNDVGSKDQKATKSSTSTTSTDSKTASAQGKEVAANSSGKPAALGSAGATPTKNPEKDKKKRRILAVAVAFILSLGLLISFQPSGEDSTALANLEADLKAAGFSSLLTGMRNGIAVVSGLVDSEESLTQVRAIAGKRPYQVQLVIWTKESYIMLARSILAAHGLFPSITLEDGAVRLRGYALDHLVERAVTSWLKNGLPDIALLKNDFITQKEVAPVLQRELSAAKLIEKIDVSWGPGLVELAFTNADESSAMSGTAYANAKEENSRLQKAMDRVRDKLGYPIAFQVWSGLEGKQILLEETKEPVVQPSSQESGQASAITRPTDVPVIQASDITRPAVVQSQSPASVAAAQNRNPFGDTISLRSVAQPADNKTSVEALPFITTSDGRLYFIGGRLTSGYVLTGIFRDRLEFTKNNVGLVYKLRGN